MNEVAINNLKGTNNKVYLITFSDLKQTIDNMKQAANKLLETTRELKEVISKSWK